ncbi:hypothetical protein L873DRAFT_596468 [Choiromyces venosus 120613-1]|uniref:Uncharacterized protein n=1 Tax=Choiromyces venosus 120613-1 TaxID=1336337 RepID=A0A3N4JY16_9PEZI|nr:hypothetical protein L873DRAFT_596468 [Choiromyces venosus 120613-1]
MNQSTVQQTCQDRVYIVKSGQAIFASESSLSGTHFPSFVSRVILEVFLDIESTVGAESEVAGSAEVSPYAAKSAQSFLNIYVSAFLVQSMARSSTRRGEALNSRVRVSAHTRINDPTPVRFCSESELSPRIRVQCHIKQPRTTRLCSCFGAAPVTTSEMR